MCERGREYICRYGVVGGCLSGSGCEREGKVLSPKTQEKWGNAELKRTNSPKRAYAYYSEIGSLAPAQRA